LATAAADGILIGFRFTITQSGTFDPGHIEERS
jgi:hypothetical protein